MAFKSEKDHSLFSGAPASNKTQLGEIKMTKPLIDLPRNSQVPLNVHINRNGFKESLHQVDVAVCDADESAGVAEAALKPGSFVKLRAECNVLAVLSNCPQMNNPCNGYKPTPIEIWID